MSSITQGQVTDVPEDAAVALVMRLQRRQGRYKLRGLLRKVTGLKRVSVCGLPAPGSDVVVRVKDNVHHFTGVWLCGSGWACPVCAAKIRFHRAHEVSRAVVTALNQGMGALFVTRTIPHSAEDELAKTLGLLAEGRRYVASQRVVKEVRAGAGYVGGIAAKEITYGLHGWHPHSHDIELFDHELSLKDFADLSHAYYGHLNRFYSGNGFTGLSREHGVRVEGVTLSNHVLAQYVTKLQEGADIRLHTAHELTRQDLKQGRLGSLMPFGMLAEFFETGDMELLDWWHEYETETRGKSVIRFTKGLRARLGLKEPEKTDEELAALEIGGDDVVRFARWFFHKITRVPGLEGKVLTALDCGGFAALVELLMLYHLDDDGGYFVAQSSHTN